MSLPAPTLTADEADKILTAKGSPFELEEIVIDGNRLKAWKNVPKSQRAMWLTSLEQWKDREFISSWLPGTDERERLTFGQVKERALVLAAWLRGHGVKVGSNVGIAGFNCSEFVVSLAAVSFLGAVPVLFNATLNAESQLHCMKVSKPILTLADEKVIELNLDDRQLKEAGCGPIVLWHSNKLMSPQRQRLIPAVDLGEVDPKVVQDVVNGVGLETLGPESDGIILFTSGYPKAVLSSQRAAMHGPMSGTYTHCRDLLMHGTSFKEIMQMAAEVKPQSVVLLATPMFHVTGCGSFLFRAVQSGIKLVFTRPGRWNTKAAVDLITKEKVSIIGGVPSIVHAVMQSPDLPLDHTFESVAYGGAASPKTMSNDVKERWPEAVVSQAFGMTESNAAAVSIAGTTFLRRPGSTGIALPIAEYRVANPDTLKDLPAGETGVVLLRGSNVMKRYVNDPKSTAAALSPDGWLNTGDVGYSDDEGYLYITDRLKDMIIRGGENIASAEIENPFYLDPRISEAAAVPLPDARLGEVVGVAITAAEGANFTAEDALSLAAPKMRQPARPVFVWLSPDPLPDPAARNANGKVLKNVLKVLVREEWEKATRKAKL